MFSLYCFGDNPIWFLNNFEKCEASSKPRSAAISLIYCGNPLEDKKHLPATNIAIVKRLINNLIYALITTGDKSTAKNLLEINETL